MVEDAQGTNVELATLLQGMAPAIADFLRRLMAVDELSWDDARKFRDEIVELNKSAKTDEEQSALLFAFISTMSRVEQLELIDGASLADFRQVCKADYLMMLAVQAMVGDAILPKRLEYITRREVEAGRLDGDDEFRRFVAQSVAPKNWIQKLFGRGK